MKPETFSFLVEMLRMLEKCDLEKGTPETALINLLENYENLLDEKQRAEISIEFSRYKELMLNRRKEQRNNIEIEMKINPKYTFSDVFY